MLYIMVDENGFHSSLVGAKIRSIEAEARKKHITLQPIRDLSEVAPEEKNPVVLLISDILPWLTDCAEKADHLGIRTIVITGAPAERLSNYRCSIISADIENGMRSLVHYLHANGKKRIALYGTNPESAPDMKKEAAFVALLGEAHIFRSHGSLEEVYRSFEKVIGDYDGVVCACDFIALSLIDRLKRDHPAEAKRLYIVGGGDSPLSYLAPTTVTTFSYDFSELGEVVFSLYRILQSLDTVARMQLFIKSALCVRDSTENKPLSPTVESPAGTQPVKPNVFLSDPMVAPLIALETLVNQCDEVDFRILHLLAGGKTYPQIAEQCFVSEGTIKYRVRNMRAVVGVASTREVIELLERYLDIERLPR